MVLEIKKFKEKVLRKKAKKVKHITPDIEELVLNMAKTMKISQGIGLAAPQVGVSKRVIVIQTDPRSERGAGLINPVIINKSAETEVGEEGCLSLPGIYLDIRRSKEVEVEALNVDGEKVKIKTDGLLARVLQHEIDHLNGVLFYRRLGLFHKIQFKIKHPFLR